MKAYIALAVLALLGSGNNEVNAVKLRNEAAFVDDIVKALADADKAEEKESKEPKKEEKKPEKKEEKKEKKDEKKDKKKEEDEVPMDNAAIKAYSSVIADAAEDSEPANPVVYNEIKEEPKAEQRLAQAPL